MIKRDFRHKHLKNQSGTVYISGLGFVNISESHSVILGIRQMSNILVTCTMLYFVLQNLFVLPITYLLYILGGKIQINFYTGLITSTSFDKTIILICANIASLICCILAVGLCYKQCLLTSKPFKKPHSGVTSIAAPIVVAMGLLGISLGVAITRAFSLIGFVFENPVKPISQFSEVSLYTFLFFLIFVTVQEIFFRGVILAPLRRFGDGFAIVIASLIFALWSNGIPQFISTFLLALPLCYFVIRSGSIYTAIVCRLSYESVLYLLQLSFGRLEHSLALVITLLAVILIVFFAGYAFATYIKTDKKSFYLAPAKDRLNLSFKLVISTCSLLFIFYFGFFIIRVISSIQIIG